MDSNETGLSELKVAEMIEDLRYEMLSRFEIQIVNLNVRLDQSIQLNEKLKEELRESNRYAQYLMEKLEDIYAKVNSHDVFINTVKKVEFELVDEIKERRNNGK
jgi:hypothetical protein